MQLRRAHNENVLIVYFWHFPFHVFRLQASLELELHVSGTTVPSPKIFSEDTVVPALKSLPLAFRAICPWCGQCLPVGSTATDQAPEPVEHEE